MQKKPEEWCQDFGETQRGMHLENISFQQGNSSVHKSRKSAHFSLLKIQSRFKSESKNFVYFKEKKCNFQLFHWEFGHNG